MALGSYIFDANTETPDSVARRRALADALLSHAMGDGQPKSVMAAIGQGIGDLGQVFAARRLGKRADQAEAAGRASVGDLSALFGGGDGGGANASGASGGGAVASTTPANAKDLATEFINLGYSPTQAAGIVGNLVQESSLNPGIAGDGGISHGLGQWNGDRFVALKQFAAANGSQWTDPKVQVRFIDHELKSSEGQAYKRLMAAQTPEQAAAAFIGYERPRGFTWDNPAGGHGYANRVAHASRIAKMLGSGQPTQVASLDPSAGMATAYPNTVTDGDVALPPGATKPQPYTSPIQGSDSDPVGMGGFLQAPPVQQLAQTIKARRASGGGGPMAPQGPGVQQLAQTLSQRGRIALGILNNPWASDGQRDVAAATLKQEMEAGDPAHQLALRKAQIELDQLLNPRPDYDYTNVDGTLIRTDKHSGDATPVYTGKAKQPTSVDEYDFYRQQEVAAGRQPQSYGDWKIANSRAGASSITVGGEPNDSKLRAKLDQNTADLWSGYQQAGATSAAMGQDMEILNELIKIAPQGPLVGRLAEMFPGFSQAGDAFQSIVKRVAPTLRAPGSGSTSDIEYDGMLRSLPALRNQPGANALIAQIMTAKARINVQRSAVIDRYSNGEITAATARQQIAAIDNQSILTPEMRKLLAGIGGGPAVPDDPAAGDDSPPPPGVDAETWKYMKPEERALWK